MEVAKALLKYFLAAGAAGAIMYVTIHAALLILTGVYL